MSRPAGAEKVICRLHADKRRDMHQLIAIVQQWAVGIRAIKRHNVNMIIAKCIAHFIDHCSHGTAIAAVIDGQRIEGEAEHAG